MTIKGRPELSLIIPAYNESKIIGNSLVRLCDYLDGNGLEYEIIVCDDFSEDETDRVAGAVASLNGRVVILKFLKRVGKGGTIRNAVKVARGDILLIIDADLPVDPNNIIETVRITKSLGGLIVGVRRIVSRGSYGVVRRFLSAGYNALVRVLFRTGVEDHQVGYKSGNVEAIKKILKEVKCDGFLFDTDLIVNAKRLHIPVKTVEVRWLDQRAERESKVRPSRTMITMLMDLFTLRLSFMFGRRLLRLKAVSDGTFIDQSSSTIHKVTHLQFDLGNRSLLDLFRKVYLAVTFDGS